MLNPQQHNDTEATPSLLSRRSFMLKAGCGGAALGLAAMLAEQQKESPAPLLPPEPPAPPQFANEHAAEEIAEQIEAQMPQGFGKAKTVIWLFMNGGPSSMDLFDPKPELERMAGKPFPDSIDALFPDPGGILPSPFSFSRHGECGADVVDLLPNLAEHVDDLAFLKACQGDSKNHGPASYQINTGETRLGHPSVGSWVTYGLGSENKDLPGFVVMCDPRSGPECGSDLWSSGFLPATWEGVMFRPQSTPVLYLNRPDGLSRNTQREQLAFLAKLNSQHMKRRPEAEALQSRIKAFELAYRMQTATPELADLSGEDQATRDLYGLEDETTSRLGRQLLVARRMAERGVRFIQVYHGGATWNWDSHQELDSTYPQLCREIDQPIAGLLTDLKQRGLLDSTLLVWGGEFGRLPVSQNGNGRDHNRLAFTSWMAGGGVKGGMSHGVTDEFGYRSVEDSVHIHDMHATILHLLGVDHTELTYRHNGRDHRLTNVYGDVIQPILA